MVKVLTVDDVVFLVQQEGIAPFFTSLMGYIEEDFAKWSLFKKTPRHATYSSEGVIELMPTANDQQYAVKLVNGHPLNALTNHLTVTALGILADVATGYPLLVSEMTLLTACRTAASSAIASKYLARKNSINVAMIGSGAQSEFQIAAHACLFPGLQVKYYDPDPKAMNKFAEHMQILKISANKTSSVQAALVGADIIITATAAHGKIKVLEDRWIENGVHINAIGGDAPGKTECDPVLLKKAKIVVEYLPQTSVEGEIQNLDSNAVYAELWELISKKKPGRVNDQEITLFDSVGFAMEDFSTLRYILHLAEKHQIGQEMNLIPKLSNPKNLFGLINVEATYR